MRGPSLITITFLTFLAIGGAIFIVAPLLKLIPYVAKVVPESALPFVALLLVYLFLLGIQLLAKIPLMRLLLFKIWPVTQKNSAAK